MSEPKPDTQDAAAVPSAEMESTRRDAAGELRHGGDQPARRPIRIYSFDPMLANTLDRIGPAVVTVNIPWEPLEPGPSGARVQVIDFDGGSRAGGRTSTCFYEPIDLNEVRIAAQGGLTPTESDPRFHQQMTYAVAMRTLEAYDRALGRRLRPVGGRLRLFPHAYRGDNAFYDPELRAVLFGYFDADRLNPGLNLPGQSIFTSLSHDIIAHEVTHALIHRIRPLLLDRTNPDVAAFHEAIGDLTAIFLHFTLDGVVEGTIAATRTRLTDPSPLAQLAVQFGYATGRGTPLRSAIDTPDPRVYRNEVEPHARGSILVAAIFEAFVTSYQRRIADLLRLATGGSGELPRGSLHPDLVNRVTREATRAADQVLTVCLRALDYLPPLDVTFSDFLRAIVTADRQLFPTDAGGLRTGFIDAFRRRGIYPEEVGSLADDALQWPSPEVPIRLDGNLRAEILVLDALSLDPWSVERTVDLPQAGQGPSQIGGPVPSASATERTFNRRDIAERLASALQPFAAALDLSPSRAIKVRDFQSTFRYDEDGAPHIDFIVQCVQSVAASDVPGFDKQLVAAVLRRATTVIFDESGRVRFVVSKPLPATDLGIGPQSRAEVRRESLRAWVDDLAAHNPGPAFGLQDGGSNPLRLNFAGLHRGLA
jgi:hypothetical protein